MQSFERSKNRTADKASSQSLVRLLRKPSDGIFSSVSRRIHNVSLVMDPSGPSFTSQVETIFRTHGIDGFSNDDDNVSSIFFQNELFRKLLKDLNGILDSKLAAHRPFKSPSQSLQKLPSKTNKNKGNESIERESGNYSQIIKRQCRELESLRARVKQVSTTDYLQGLMEQLEETREEIERIKRAKREAVGSTRGYGKALEDLVETKEGLPESLQKSNVVESDLLILGLKNKGLRKKAMGLEVTMESLARKEEKVERELENVVREAKGLGVNLGENGHRTAKFEELKGKFERFKGCLEGIKTKNQRIIRKNEADNREIRGKIYEKDMKIREEINKVIGVQEKLKALMRDDNVDKNLKEVLDLFAGGRTELEESGRGTGESNKNDKLKHDFEEKKGIFGSFEENKEQKIVKKEENINEYEEIERKTNKIEEKVEVNEFYEDKSLENSEPEGYKLMENSNKPTEKFEAEKEAIEHLETEKKAEIEPLNIHETPLDLPKHHEESPKEQKITENAEKTPKIPKRSSKTINKPKLAHIDQNHNKEETKKNSEEIEETQEFNNKESDLADFKESTTPKKSSLVSSNLHSKPLKKLDGIGSGTLIILPKSFKQLSSDLTRKSTPLLFCRVKLGAKAFNTKISEDRKPKWDERIEIRRGHDETQLFIQVWNFDPRGSEQLVGEALMDLGGQGLNIEKTKVYVGEIEIMENGGKRGTLEVEMEWNED